MIESFKNDQIIGINLKGDEILLSVPNFLPDEIQVPDGSLTAFHPATYPSNQPLPNMLKMRRFKKHVYKTVLVIYQEIP